MLTLSQGATITLLSCGVLVLFAPNSLAGHLVFLAAIATGTLFLCVILYLLLVLLQ
ncbi:MAG: hypothetical protein ABJZ55_22390 [Fuerstiella sp.]